MMNRLTFSVLEKWLAGLCSGLIVMVSSGCATTTPASFNHASYTSSPVAAEQGSLGALPAQSLAAGDCGLFLWPKQRNAELGFFVSAMTGNGRISWGGQLRELSRMTTDGNDHFGIHDRESFVGEGVELSVRIVPDLSRPVANGVLVANASMRVTDDSGASVVIPAAGLVACED